MNGTVLDLPVLASLHDGNDPLTDFGTQADDSGRFGLFRSFKYRRLAKAQWGSGLENSTVDALI